MVQDKVLDKVKIACRYEKSPIFGRDEFCAFASARSLKTFFDFEPSGCKLIGEGLVTPDSIGFSQDDDGCDRNHPSIIAWTPFNETGHYAKPAQHRRLHIDCYNLCKALDPTRPVNDASGWIHHITDLWKVHSYIQEPEKLRDQLTPSPEGDVFRNHPKEEPDYTGQPYLVDEYGGIKWIPPTDPAFAENSWGYGNAPQSLEEFYTRLEGLTNVLLGLDHVSGYCYTQLTDVEQEQNGIYNYDRSEKFDMTRIHHVFSRHRIENDHANDH